MSDPISAAEMHIADAKEHGDSWLILNLPTAAPLPESLQDLSAQLEKLTIASERRCGLPGLPDWLGSFTRLRELHLCDVSLPTLPACLRQLSGLERMVLSGTGVMEIPEWLVELGRLTTLVPPEKLRPHAAAPVVKRKLASVR